MTTLEEKLRAEERICSQCRYAVVNPFTKRCPRCLTALPAIEAACHRCAYSCNCPETSAAPNHKS